MPSTLSRALFTALLAIGLMAQAPAQPTPDATWQQFLAWLKTVPPNDSPGSLIRDYRQHLVATGLSEDAAATQLRSIMLFMRTREDGWQQIFNKIYTASSPGFNIKPNALLVHAVEGHTPGRALDVGMGQGRNSVFLAIKGWDVTGFDVSDAGLDIARKNAAAAGVTLKALQSSDSQFDFGTSQWDLIVITYEPFPLTNPVYVQKLANALRPGGLLVIESFASDKSQKDRKPVDLDPPDLLQSMASFRILHFEDVADVSDWSLEKTRLARLIAQKK